MAARRVCYRYAAIRVRTRHRTAVRAPPFLLEIFAHERHGGPVLALLMALALTACMTRWAAALQQQAGSGECRQRQRQRSRWRATNDSEITRAIENAFKQDELLSSTSISVSSSGGVVSLQWQLALRRNRASVCIARCRACAPRRRGPISTTCQNKRPSALGSGLAPRTYCRTLTMCGIGGELRYDGSEPDWTLMGRMLPALARRSPDLAPGPMAQVLATIAACR